MAISWHIRDIFARKNKPIYDTVIYIVKRSLMTKTVATLGPSSMDKIDLLIKTGVDVFRLNFSHADRDTHKIAIQKIRETAKKLNTHTAIMQDISGPKIRIGRIEGILELKRGDHLRLVRSDPKSPYEITLNYPQVLQDLEVGEYIFFADGSIRAKVVAKGEGWVEVVVLNEGTLSSHKGVNFPDTNLSLQAITPKDEKDLIFGAKMGVDLVAVSFVNKAQDMLKAREILRAAGSDAWLIAKIETRAGVERFEEIMQASDGIMVARGDLGIEVGIEHVPIIQKRIIKKANQAKKPVITATQMLLSMVNSPYPTRAEASDVANAVLDGSDALMLSDETAVGKYPVESVRTLAKIVQKTQQIYPFFKRYETKEPDAIAKSVADLCQAMEPRAIVSFTTAGTTVRSIAKYRPATAIIAVTHQEKIARRLSLVWGVQESFVIAPKPSPEELIEEFLSKCSCRSFTGDKLVVTMGSIVGKEGTTNMIRILEI